MGEEKPAEFYDGKKYMNPNIYERYKPMYEAAADMLPENLGIKIIDLGCGVGHFANIIKEKGYINYIGYDFSTKMLKRARANCPDAEFIKADLFLKALYEEEGVFVLLETLEHITKDTEIISNIPKGSIVIFSVPSFDAKSHVRKFKSIEQVVCRYTNLLDFKVLHELPWKNNNKVFIFRCKRK